MIVTGESSGELYGALLAHEIRLLRPGVRILGVGGERMRAAGVEVFAGIAGAMGLVEALGALKSVRETFRDAASRLREVRPDVLVLIDYPDFNFRLAREAKALGLRVLYYVSPQLWAWRKGRIREMPRIADRVALVLPFEKELYDRVGMRADFVGHPILDEIAEHAESMAESREALGLKREGKCIALLPGSRRSELDRLLPVLYDFLLLYGKRHGSARFVLPVAPNVDRGRYRDWFDRFAGAGVRITEGGAARALRAADAAVVASGTATLQATLLGTPTVVVYKLNPVTYFIGKLLVDVKYVSITNLVLGRESIPELLQGRAEAGAMVASVEGLLEDGERRAGVMRDIDLVRGIFGGPGASRRVARIVGEMAGWVTQGAY
jgi:lipid-A-disaccharide synthase